MWKLKLDSREDGLHTLYQSTTFTSLNKVLTFHLYLEGEEGQIEINFVSKRDKNKKNYYTEIGELENRSITVTYFNPATGTSGPIEPLNILENEDYYFKMMYSLNMLKETDTYELSIEFFIQKK